MKGTVLITGANSGLGFDAARQLAESGGWRKIVLGARSEAKASAAAERLAELTGKSRGLFCAAVMDLNVPDAVLSAVQTLSDDGVKLDGVVLNAGDIPRLKSDGAPRVLPSGQNELYAMNVGGHALLVHQLLDRGLLAAGATVMLSGTEAVLSALDEEFLVPLVLQLRGQPRHEGAHEPSLVFEVSNLVLRGTEVRTGEREVSKNGHASPGLSCQQRSILTTPSNIPKRSPAGKARYPDRFTRPSTIQFRPCPKGDQMGHLG